MDLSKYWAGFYEVKLSPVSGLQPGLSATKFDFLHLRMTFPDEERLLPMKREVILYRMKTWLKEVIRIQLQ